MKKKTINKKREKNEAENMKIISEEREKNETYNKYKQQVRSTPRPLACSLVFP